MFGAEAEKMQADDAKLKEIVLQGEEVIEPLKAQMDKIAALKKKIESKDEEIKSKDEEIKRLEEYILHVAGELEEIAMISREVLAREQVVDELAKQLEASGSGARCER
jgi:predicted RNase H-like nuclease (RuvC/YqgF family)